MNQLKKIFSFKTTIAVGIFLGTISMGTSALASSFMGLGVLAEDDFSDAFGVSGDGTTVVGLNSMISGGQEAFRWTDSEGMVGLGFLPGDNGSWAQGASADGEVVVGFSRILSSPGELMDEAFRWTSSEGMVGLGLLPGDNSSEAFDVSANGQVIVGIGSDSIAREAFRWTPSEGMVGLGFLPGTDDSAASGISADGQVVVGDSGGEAFRWTPSGGMVGLGFLPGTDNSSARGISADGQVVVGSSGNAISGREAFRWTPSEGMVSLGSLPNTDNIIALGSSGTGDIIVGIYILEDPDPMGGSSLRSFIWDEINGIRDLQEVLINDFGLGSALSGWNLSIARDISDDGLTITGSGRNPSGGGEAWIAQTVPEPSQLLGLGFTTVIGFLSSIQKKKN